MKWKEIYLKKASRVWQELQKCNLSKLLYCISLLSPPLGHSWQLRRPQPLVSDWTNPDEVGASKEYEKPPLSWLREMLIRVKNE